MTTPQFAVPVNMAFDAPAGLHPISSDAFYGLLERQRLAHPNSDVGAAAYLAELTINTADFTASLAAAPRMIGNTCWRLGRFELARQYWRVADLAE